MRSQQQVRNSIPIVRDDMLSTGNWITNPETILVTTTNPTGSPYTFVHSTIRWYWLKNQKANTNSKKNGFAFGSLAFSNDEMWAQTKPQRWWWRHLKASGHHQSVLPPKKPCICRRTDGLRRDARRSIKIVAVIQMEQLKAAGMAGVENDITVLLLL